MNKLLKYILVGIAIISTGITCFSSADSVGSLLTVSNVDTSATSSSWTTFLDLSSVITSDSTICMKIIYDGSMSYGFQLGSSNGNNQDPYNTLNIYSSVVNAGNYVCMAVGPTNYMRVKNRDSGTKNISIDYFVLNGFLGTDLPLMTSLQCQTEYNLIPISEVTANYCRLNFDLISPLECPINSGTGAIVRSNLMINDIPYAQNQNINVFIPDFLSWNISYNDLYTVIEVEGYDADEEYIENVINNEKLTPTNEDFANMLTGITAFIPYLFIGLLFFRFVRIINKIWK